MLGVVLHIQVARELAANCSDECVDWPVALGGECLARAIDIDVRRDFGIACGRIAAQFVADQVVVGYCWQVLVGERFPHFDWADFAARVLGEMLNVLRELDLQTARQVEAVLGLHDVRNTTLARLAVDADNRFVGATNMFRVERQIGNAPLVVILGECFEAFLDGVLMAARKCGVDQVANIRMALWHGKTVAIFGIASQCVDVGDVQFGVDAVDEQVHCQRDDVDIARALAVAEESSFNAIGTGHHAKLGCSNCTAAVVVGVK